jgi:hypothetical protein
MFLYCFTDNMSSHTVYVQSIMDPVTERVLGTPKSYHNEPPPCSFVVIDDQMITAGKQASELKRAEPE